jgi:ribonuclease HI
MAADRDRPSPAEVLRFIAREEPLARTLEQFPGVSRDELRGLLEAFADAARRSEERQLAEVRSPLPRAVASPPVAAPRPTHGVAAGRFPRLTVFSDGAARGNPGPAGAGAVLVAPDGTVIEELGKYLGINTNNFAEYTALLIGLRRALELGAREVDVRADSELLIRQLQGKYKVKAANLQPLFQEAMALLRRFDRFHLAHVYREQNKHADEMSNRAIDERM